MQEQVGPPVGRERDRRMARRDPPAAGSQQRRSGLAIGAEGMVRHRHADPVLGGGEVVAGIEEVGPAGFAPDPAALDQMGFPQLVVLQHQGRLADQAPAVFGDALGVDRRAQAGCDGRRRSGCGARRLQPGLEPRQVVGHGFDQRSVHEEAPHRLQAGGPRLQRAQQRQRPLVGLSWEQARDQLGTLVQEGVEQAWPYAVVVRLPEQMDLAVVDQQVGVDDPAPDQRLVRGLERPLGRGRAGDADGQRPVRPARGEAQPELFAHPVQLRRPEVADHRGAGGPSGLASGGEGAADELPSLQVGRAQDGEGARRVVGGHHQVVSRRLSRSFGADHAGIAVAVADFRRDVGGQERAQARRLSRVLPRRDLDAGGARPEIGRKPLVQRHPGGLLPVRETVGAGLGRAGARVRPGDVQSWRLGRVVATPLDLDHEAEGRPDGRGQGQGLGGHRLVRDRSRASP